MYYFNLKPSTEYNGSFKGEVPCECCGFKKISKERIDTENIFNHPESFCFPCYFEQIMDHPNLCPKKKKLLQAWTRPERKYYSQYAPMSKFAGTRVL